MISKMRSWAPTIMVIILVSFVIGTIFFNWGMNRGSSSGPQTNVVGKVNGHEVPLNYFDREVNNERQRMERGANADDQYQSHMIPRQVWEQQVTQMLMGEFFRKVNLFASADEVFDYLKHNPPPGIDTASALMTNGVFDTAKYVTALNDPRTYEYNTGFRALEQRTRELIIPVQKLETLLAAPLLPTRAELEYQYRAENEKAVFEYAYVKSGAVTTDNAGITDGMVAGYYAAHRDTFKCDEQIDMYVVKFLKKATARDEQTYCQELMDIKRKVMAEKSAARSEAFAEEAKVSSDDEGSAQNGGDLGVFRKGAMVREFDSVAFKLADNTVSDPVKTSFGYHLIFVEKHQKQGKVDEVRARHILRKIVPTMETNDALTEKADSLRRKMLDEGFVKVAHDAARKDPSIVFDSTGLFSRGGMIPRVGYVSGIGRFIMSKDNEPISERLENSNGFYLFAVKLRVPRGFTPLEAVKSRIKATLADSLRQQAVRRVAEALSKKIGEQTSLAALKKTDSLLIGSGVTDTVTRMSYVAGIGSDSKVAAVAFALPVGKRSGIIDQEGTCYFVRTLWKGPQVSLPVGSSQVSAMAGRMMSQLRQRIYLEWYMDYKSRQNVVSNIDKLYID
jgi:peptidyl-prolyl cis-trans isomerase D